MRANCIKPRGSSWKRQQRNSNSLWSNKRNCLNWTTYFSDLKLKDWCDMEISRYGIRIKVILKKKKKKKWMKSRGKAWNWDGRVDGRCWFHTIWYHGKQRVSVTMRQKAGNSNKISVAQWSSTWEIIVSIKKYTCKALMQWILHGKETY